MQKFVTLFGDKKFVNYAGCDLNTFLQYRSIPEQDKAPPSPPLILVSYSGPHSQLSTSPITSNSPKYHPVYYTTFIPYWPFIFFQLAIKCARPQAQHI